MFTHYLITRFNIRVSGSGPESMDSSAIGVDWFEKRMKLFNAICAPSVLGQKNRNFEWLIYLDPGTSLEGFLWIAKGGLSIQFLYVADYEAMIVDLINRVKSAPAPYVITTRLDNDDVLSSVFIGTIQKAFQPRDKLIINLNSGFDYHSRIHLLTKWNRRYRNHFISLIENTNAVKIYSVYGFPHWRPPAEAEIVNIDGQPFWLYWRHSLNYSDQVKAGIPVLSKPDLSLFPASVQSISISWKNTLVYFAKWLPGVLMRRMKQRVRK